MTRKSSKLPLFILLASMSIVFLSLLIGVAMGNTHTVDDDGTSDFTDIQSAINASASGDTIEVMNGTYEGNITITKPLIIRGEGGEAPVIQVNNSLTSIQITSSNVHFSNFMVTNVIDFSLSHALVLSDCYNCTIENTKFSQRFTKGILVDRGGNNSLVNNTVGKQMEFRFSMNNTITGNTIDFWIDINDGSSGNLVEDNVCRSSIFLTETSNDNVIRNNTVEAINIRSSGGNLIESNSIGNSLSVHGGYHNSYHGNEFTSGGFYLMDSAGDRTFYETTDIAPTNTVNGKQIIYRVGEGNRSIPENAGQVILAFCDTIMISGLDINNSYGISLFYSTNCTIRNTRLENPGTGISLIHCTGTAILNTTCTNSQEDGIHSQYSLGTTIRGSTILNSTRYGIRIFTDIESGDIIEQTTVGGSGKDGISIKARGIYLSQVLLQENTNGIVMEGDRVTMSHITIDVCNHTGIWIEGDGSIMDNLSISNTTEGVQLSRGEGNEIIDSRFSENVNGIVIEGFSIGNSVLTSHFLNNDEYGVVIWGNYQSAQTNTLKDNTFTDNGLGGIDSPENPDADNDSDTPDLLSVRTILSIIIAVAVAGILMHMLKSKVPPGELVEVPPPKGKE